MILRLEVADDLALFSAFERIDPDGGSVIHACFKHFHHIGEYHHGRGREYKVWHVNNYPSRLLPTFERSCGNRQNLKFDGCIPLLLHRITIAEFVRGYLDCPKSEGKLDKSIYTVIRCNEFVGLLCANSLWEDHFQPTLPLAVGQGFEDQGLEHLQNVGDPRRGEDGEDRGRSVTGARSVA
jgi:hypothetical protein